jgi:hypothetical protein
MDAGRELDALVAEKIFGWLMIDAAAGIGAPDHSGLSAIAAVPHYSTDIAAVWQIVEHFGRKAASVDVSRRMRGYRCVIVWDGPNADARAESAPLAICLAGLRACDVKVPD